MEDLSKLGADMLLYKASAAHNLPVMCQAMALGADKNWTNPEDKDRTHLHQAVVSVSSLVQAMYRDLEFWARPKISGWIWLPVVTD